MFAATLFQVTILSFITHHSHSFPPPLLSLTPLSYLPSLAAIPCSFSTTISSSLHPTMFRHNTFCPLPFPFHHSPPPLHLTPAAPGTRSLRAWAESLVKALHALLWCRAEDGWRGGDSSVIRRFDVIVQLDISVTTCDLA